MYPYERIYAIYVLIMLIYHGRSHQRCTKFGDIDGYKGRWERVRQAGSEDKAMSSSKEEEECRAALWHFS